MGDVVDGRADIGFGAGINSLRFKYADLAGVMEFMVLSFVTGKQPPEFTWLTMFGPFTNAVWFSIGVSTVFGFAILIVLNKAKIVRNYAHYLKQFEFIFLSFFENGRTPPEMKGKIKLKFYTTFWSLICLTIGTAYKSIIVELLSFPLNPETPKDFKELSIRTDYKWELQFYGGLAFDLFRLSTNPTMKRISGKMELEPDPVKCYGRSLNSKFACITYSTLAEYAILKDFTNRYGRSDLRVAEKSREFFVAVGPVVKKGSPLHEPFEWAIGKIVDTGLFEKWKNMDYENVRRKKFKDKSPVGDGHVKLLEEPTGIVLRLRNLKGGFGILFAGLCLSWIAFVVENSLNMVVCIALILKFLRM